MRVDPIFYPFVGALLILLMMLILRFWRLDKPAPAVPTTPRRKREPKPFAGYTHKPQCELCEQGAEHPPPMPGAPPPRMSFTRGRPRQVETRGHFCPHTTCSYPGGVDFGNIRANGHPNGRHWRQLVC